ncbi:MAG: hypothetical protein ABJB12_20375 [Pseudomonadota bacterium]
MMSSTCCALFSAACAFTLLSAGGCGTDAKGVDDCRDIEQARCAAAKNCGLVADVGECQRFYRDQCLHGLAVSLPTSTQLKKCVATINGAGMCAMADSNIELSACDGVTQSAPDAKTACDLVTNPELASECSFLAPDADGGSSLGGGAAGANDGDSSAAAGAAGASGSAGS